MSEENKDFGDKTNDAFEGAKETTKEFADDVKDSAQEFAQSAKETLNNGENKKIIAGLLAILIGSLGIHKFILGYTKEGVIQIIASIVTCGIAGIIPFIEGIIYLTKSDEDFYNTYQVGRRPWF